VAVGLNFGSVLPLPEGALSATWCKRMRVMLAATTFVAATAAAAADDGDAFSQGVQALRRGLHAKAWELLRTHYRGLDPAAAWASAPLQESLCVCAVKMRKTTVAISACRNASELRSPSHMPPASLSLLMARGEARMMAGQPSQAWDEFRSARDTAVRGEALKQEKEAEEAMRRCEQALLVSYTRQRGAVVTTTRAQELKRGSFASLAGHHVIGSAILVVPQWCRSGAAACCPGRLRTRGFGTGLIHALCRRGAPWPLTSAVAHVGPTSLILPVEPTG
jgi:hypothetical protein